MNISTFIYYDLTLTRRTNFLLVLITYNVLTHRVQSATELRDTFLYISMGIMVVLKKTSTTESNMQTLSRTAA